jgi:hypothetical protein
MLDYFGSSHAIFSLPKVKWGFYDYIRQQIEDIREHLMQKCNNEIMKFPFFVLLGKRNSMSKTFLEALEDAVLINIITF